MELSGPDVLGSNASEICKFVLSSPWGSVVRAANHDLKATKSIAGVRFSFLYLD